METQDTSLPLLGYTGRQERLATAIRDVTSGEPGFFSVAVADTNTNFEWSVNVKPMRAASLIKLFVMAQIFEEKEQGRLLFSDTLAFQETDIVSGAGVLQHKSTGESHTIAELVELMITESDNIATNLLINRIGMETINNCAARFGCSNTVLQRHMMDFVAAAEGRENTTSTTDVASLLLRMHKRACIDAIADSSMCDILKRQTDRCKIPLLLPAGTICRNKTGELPGAEHDAGIVTCPSGTYIVAIMSDELPDPKAGRRTVAAISKVVFDWYCENKAFRKNRNVV